MSSGSGANKVRQVEAISAGTVIDHLPPEATLKIVGVLAGHDDQVFVGINLRSSRHGQKGVVKIAHRELTDRELAILALIAPQASVCIIRDYAVVSKHTVAVPDRFDGLARCANPNCVTNHEKWPTSFIAVSHKPLLVSCRYCERGFTADELQLL